MIPRRPAAAFVLAFGLLGAVGVQRGPTTGTDAVPEVRATPTATAVPSATPVGGVAVQPSASPQTALPKVWRHGSRKENLVALTFDDGWNEDNVRSIFATLQRLRAPATFFPVARAVLRHPETWRMVAQRGFPLANHSWNHDDLSKKTSAKASADIERATAAIQAVTGVALLPALRPPFGEQDDDLLAAARDAGIQAVVMWDVDTRDWTGEKARIVYRNAVRVQPGSIVVMHTDKDNTVRALPKIITALRKRGYTLVTVGQLLGLPGSVPLFEPVPPPLGTR